MINLLYKNQYFLFLNFKYFYNNNKKIYIFIKYNDVIII